jgi:hypothetical protein
LLLALEDDENNIEELFYMINIGQRKRMKRK